MIFRMGNHMGTKILWVMGIVLWGAFVCLADDLTGRQIIEEQQNRHTADNEFSDVTLILVDRKGKEKHQHMVIYTLKNQAKTKSLIQYLGPANIRGVGLLTWEQGDREDDQWLYMSASRSFKRIAGGCKKNQFMGTDMAFEDLRAENLDVHEYIRRPDNTIADQKCWVIEAIPSTEMEKKLSGYGKRELWIDQSNFYPVKVDFFDPHGRHTKTATFEDVRPVKGKLYRSFKVTWDRVRQKTSTIMAYEKIDLDTPNKNGLFTQNYMKRPIR